MRLALLLEALRTQLPPPSPGLPLLTEGDSCLEGPWLLCLGAHPWALRQVVSRSHLQACAMQNLKLGLRQGSTARHPPAPHPLRPPPAACLACHPCHCRLERSWH